ncbi:MAG: hypothetical protein AAGI48_05880 [Verrucomicrobiota bacterium]
MKSIVRLSLVTILAASLTGCLTRRTVTVGGETVESGYVVKRPIKEAIDNSKKN